MKKQIKDIKNFLKKEQEKGCLFLLEKYLDALPHDWFDAISFIFSNGIDQNKDCLIINMDEKQTEVFCKITAMENVKVYILSDKKVDGKNIIYDIWLTKEYLDGDPDPKKLFVGGENLRKFCDEKNIFYKSSLTDDNILLSGSNLMWQKNEGEDCRNK